MPMDGQKITEMTKNSDKGSKEKLKYRRYSVLEFFSSVDLCAEIKLVKHFPLHKILLNKAFHSLGI